MELRHVLLLANFVLAICQALPYSTVSKVTPSISDRQTVSFYPPFTYIITDDITPVPQANYYRFPRKNPTTTLVPNVEDAEESNSNKLILVRSTHCANENLKKESQILSEVATSFSSNEYPLPKISVGWKNEPITTFDPKQMFTDFQLFRG